MSKGLSNKLSSCNEHIKDESNGDLSEDGVMKEEDQNLFLPEAQISAEGEDPDQESDTASIKPGQSPIAASPNEAGLTYASPTEFIKEVPPEE